MKITADYHLHSFLSTCAKAHATPENYAKAAKERGLTTVGISDHVWDSYFPGAPEAYKPQTVEHTMLIKESGVPGTIDGVRFLLGCEADMDKNGVVGLTEENAALYDYVMVSVSHFQFPGFTVEEGDLKDHRTVRKRILDRIYRATEIPFISGLSHPFRPTGINEGRAELIAGFTDSELTDCFKAVAKAKKAIEINLKVFNNKNGNDEQGTLYKRIYTLAREQGCLFYFGSDAHKPEGLCRYELGERFAEACGITEDRFVPLENLGKRGQKNV